jgi:L-fuculose-phosphate aldolase
MTDPTPAFLTEGSDQIVTRLRADMQAQIGLTPLSDRERIALACRYLADHDHASTLAGQVSLKLDDGTFWTTGFATGFADAAVSNMVRVDENLKVVEGVGMANPATRFHMWVYANRPELRSIVHTHPPHASVLATCGQPLVVSHMDMMMFHDDVAQLDQWPGVPLANEEGRIISGALGGKNSILLANHGILTAGDSLEKAVYLAVHLEHAARLQLLGAAAGYQPLPVSPDLALEARTFLTSAKLVSMTFDYWSRQARKRHPDALD